MIVIGRAIEGSALNGLEYLMQDEDNTKLNEFEDIEAAKSFLRGIFQEDVTDEDLEESFFFVDTKDLVKVDSEKVDSEEE